MMEMVDDQSLCTKTNRKGERSLETPQSISFFSPQAFEEGYQGRTKNTEERTNNNEDQLNTHICIDKNWKEIPLMILAFGCYIPVPGAQNLSISFISTSLPH